MRILIACEESQAVCKAFREKGFEAYSCDIKTCTGGHPEWHIIGDAIEVAYGQHWDLMIGHPPCTYLSYAGNRWFNIERYGDAAKERYKKRDWAVEFFIKLLNAPIKHIAIENPRGYIQTIVPYNQMIHPYYFGDECSKVTLLWLKNLPFLEHHRIDNLFGNKTHVYKGEMCPSGAVALFGTHTLSLTKEERSTLRSKTFPGIASAMATQWGDYINQHSNI